MATSQNGYSANDRGCVASYSIPGGKVALRTGDVSVVLLWCANEWHRTVEPLSWPGNWGYAERTIRGSSTTLSNHASGTAIDLNAPRHPLGKVGTFTAPQRAALRRIIDHCEGVIRWGGDYSGRKDEMHLEINAGSVAVRRIADKIRSGAPGGGGDWFDMATREELAQVVNDAIDRKLGRVIWETTGSLPNRRGPDGTEIPGGGVDSLFGYAMNADGASFRIEQLLREVAGRIGAGPDGPMAITEADRTALAREVADVLATRLAQ